MELLILADYYEEKGFIKKATRLRKRNTKVIFGNFRQYNEFLSVKVNCVYVYGGGGWILDYTYEHYYDTRRIYR